MPQYKLNDIPVDLWARFKERAQREGWPLRALFLQLMDDYAQGRIERLSGLAPQQMPTFGWLRPFYRIASRDPDFVNDSSVNQWERLTETVVGTSATYLNWVNAIPHPLRPQVLNWLAETSQDPRPGPNRLSMRAIAHAGEGPSLSVNRRVIQYEVLGMPPGQQALIAHFPNLGWQIMRIRDGQQTPYEGHYADADEARQALEARLYLEEDLPGDTKHA